jgi:hypothetical protein
MNRFKRKIYASKIPRPHSTFYIQFSSTAQKLKLFIRYDHHTRLLQHSFLTKTTPPATHGLIQLPVIPAAGMTKYLQIRKRLAQWWLNEVQGPNANLTSTTNCVPCTDRLATTVMAVKSRK